MGSHYDDMDSRTECSEERLSRAINFLEERVAKLEKELAKVSKPPKDCSTKRSLEDFLETYQSLQESITKARGCVQDPKRILSMTVSDLLELIGPNNIRFVYKGERKNG